MSSIFNNNNNNDCLFQYVQPVHSLLSKIISEQFTAHPKLHACVGKPRFVLHQEDLKLAESSLFDASQHYKGRYFCRVCHQLPLQMRISYASSCMSKHMDNYYLLCSTCPAPLVCNLCNDPVYPENFIKPMEPIAHRPSEMRAICQLCHENVLLGTNGDGLKQHIMEQCQELVHCVVCQNKMSLNAFKQHAPLCLTLTDCPLFVMVRELLPECRDYAQVCCAFQGTEEQVQQHFVSCDPLKFNLCRELLLLSVHGQKRKSVSDTNESKDPDEDAEDELDTDVLSRESDGDDADDDDVPVFERHRQITYYIWYNQAREQIIRMKQMSNGQRYVALSDVFDAIGEKTQSKSQRKHTRKQFPKDSLFSNFPAVTKIIDPTSAGNHSDTLIVSYNVLDHWITEFKCDVPGRFSGNEKFKAHARWLKSQLRPILMNDHLSTDLPQVHSYTVNQKCARRSRPTEDKGAVVKRQRVSPPPILQSKDLHTIFYVQYDYHGVLASKGVLRIQQMQNERVYVPLSDLFSVIGQPTMTAVQTKEMQALFPDECCMCELYSAKCIAGQRDRLYMEANTLMVSSRVIAHWIDIFHSMSGTVQTSYCRNSPKFKPYARWLQTIVMPILNDFPAAMTSESVQKYCNTYPSGVSTV